MSDLTIDINGFCNESCSFCYQDLDGSSLPEDEIFRLVDSSNSDSVSIGGGEPFIDPRILSIINGIRSRDKLVHIATNGSVIPNGLLDLEEKVRDGVQIQVSLHASNPVLYEKITGKPFFDTVLRNISSLKEGFSVSMTSSIYNDNFDDVSGIISLAKGLLIPLRVNLVFPVGKGRSVKPLDSRQLSQLRGYLLQQRVLNGDLIDSPLIHSNNCYALRDAYGISRTGICPLDRGKVYASPNGKVVGCEFYSRDVVDVNSGGLSHE